MKLYRPTYSRNGKHKTVKVWWVSFSVQGERIRRSTGSRDERAAREIANRLLVRAEREAAGLHDPHIDAAGRSLEDLLQDFEQHLRSGAPVEQHVVDRLARLREFVADTGARRLRDLQQSKAERWLNSQHDGGLSARSVNRRMQALRQFGRWLWRSNLAPRDPFEGLRARNEAVDRRRVRRALRDDELVALIEAARSRPLAHAKAQRTTAGVTEVEQERLEGLGRTRALVYALASGTGLRAGELKRLRWRDVDLEKGRVTVTAQSAKSRREQQVPLREDLRQALLDFRPAGSRPGCTVIPPGLFPSLRAFKRDLAHAGLIRTWREEIRGADGRVRTAERFDTTDEDGRVLDFHALRHTFITQLATAGVHPRMAQALARHSKIELTMATYTDLTLLDLESAVEQTGHGVGQVLHRKEGQDSRSAETKDSARPKRAGSGP